jgi:hypothetical protein
MAANVNIDKFLRNIGSQVKTSTADASMSFSEWSSKLIYVGFLLLAIAVILILIHYLVTPIFKTKLGSKGFIPLPTTPEGQILWDEQTPDSIPTTGTLIESIAANYTVSMDIFIERPNDITNAYRTIFVRQVASAKSTASTNPTTIQDQIDDYNLAVYLEKGANDLYASVMCSNKTVKTIKLKNTPVREPFRLVVVLSDTYMDLYINGQLSGSVTFSSTPLTGANVIFGPSTSSVKVKRVKVFDRTLEPAEAKDIRPALAGFEASGDIPDSSTCSTFSAATVKEGFVGISEQFEESNPIA